MASVEHTNGTYVVEMSDEAKNILLVTTKDGHRSIYISQNSDLDISDAASKIPYSTQITEECLITMGEFLSGIGRR